MKILIGVFALLFVGCASIHRVPKENRDLNSFEYCGGELWGYMLPLGPREDKPWYSRNFNDPMPLMAVYLHMHSDLAENPTRALMLFIDVRSRVGFSIQIPNQVIDVQIDGSKPQHFQTKFYITKEMKTARERFPSPKYETKLVDAKTNTWSVAKVNQFAYFIKQAPEIVQMPEDRHYELKNEKIEVQLNNESEKQIWVRGMQNLWPQDQALRDAKISVLTPTIIVNGQSIEGKSFAFDMNYQATEKRRNRPGTRPCPSSEMIFHRND